MNPKKLPTHIKKGHQLVFSQQDLTAREANLFGLMIANMRPDDWDNNTPEYRFTAAQLSEWLGLNNRAIGSQLKDVVSRLSSRKIGIIHEVKGETEFEFTPLFKKAKYKDRILTLVPNDALSKEYVEYNKGFSLINTKTYLGLKREYTKRLYEMLSRFKGDKKLHSMEIEALKAFMGVLDEQGNVKDNKQSFSSNSVFITRCIKDSIVELSEDPKTRKEILFHESADGLGIKLHKHGRNVHSIEFLYSWINVQNPVEQLNFDDAKNIITKLETKRLTTQEPLSIEELKSLAAAYRVIEEPEQAEKIETAIAKRGGLETGNLEEDQDKSFLDKIRMLQGLNGEVDY
ncbi:MAG: replication initiation protein [Vibrio sp.]